MNRNTIPLLLIAVALVAPSWLVAAETARPETASFFPRSCLDCHDSSVKEGGLDLSALTFDPASPENFARWVLIHDRVRAGEMPPAGSLELDADDVEQFCRDVATALEAAEGESLGAEGRSSRRRMNRYEYENSLRDLLGIPVLEIRDFLPEDRVAHGFNKVGDALDVSHVQMARYLSAAEHALRQAMAPQANRPVATVQRYYAWDMPGFRKRAGPAIRMTHRIYDMRPAPEPRRGRRGGPRVEQPLTVDGAHHDREKEAVVMLTSTYEPAEIQYNRFRAPMTAKYRLRFSGFSIWMSHDFRTITRGRAPEPVTVYSDRTPGLFRKLFSYDVGPEPTVVQQEVWMIAGETIRPDATRLVRTRPPDFRNPLAEEDGMPGVAWQWMEVEGPIFNEWPPIGHQRMFADLPLTDVPDGANTGDAAETNERLSAIGLRSFQPPRGVHVASSQPVQDAERLLRRFMRQVYRRPLVEEDVQLFLGIAKRALSSDYSFTEAMLAAYTGILSSPAFLFFDEAPGQLSDRALADRLSFFLWNTRPDEELLRLARQGELRRPEVLRQQTDRLLDDARCSQFVHSFLDYWVDLRWIIQTSPDVELYPEYDLDDLLVESAIDETRLYFGELLGRNLGVSHLVDSDFSFLNNRLAVHYGIPDVDGIEMRRTPLPKESVRGGLLTQASVLKVTANGTTTSPVIRGAWVMDRLLGKPPPPPPSAVPAVEPDTRGATTIREQLEKHRSQESCNACHRHIDPAGFALENFDVLGGWRDRYRSLGEGEKVQGVGHNGLRFRYLLAQPVDPSGELPDGQVFQDVRQLKECLLRNQEQLARNLVNQLTIYATGAPVRFSDRPAIAAILERARDDEYGLRTMVHEIVQSELFRHK